MNKQTYKQKKKHKLIDTDNRMVVIGGEEELGKDEESKGNQVHGDRRRLNFRW